MSDPITLPITTATKAWVALGITALGTVVTSTLGILAVTSPTSPVFYVLTVLAALLTVVGVPFGVYKTSNAVVGTRITEPSQLSVVPVAAPPVLEAPAAPTVDPTEPFAPVASPTADV